MTTYDLSQFDAQQYEGPLSTTGYDAAVLDAQLYDGPRPMQAALAPGWWEWVTSYTGTFGTATFGAQSFGGTSGGSVWAPMSPKMWTGTAWVNAVFPINPGGGTGGGGGGTGGGINTLIAVTHQMSHAHIDYPYGPLGYSWEQGPDATADHPPGGYTAATMWGTVNFGHSGPGGDQNVRIQLRYLELYVLVSGVWHVGQQCNSANIGVQVQSADYTVSGPAANVRDETGNGGGVSVLMPKGTVNGSVAGLQHWSFQFYPNTGRADVSAYVGSIQSGFTTFQTRLILDAPAGTDDRHLGNYVANSGGDWWQSLTSGYPSNGQLAQGQMVRIPQDGSWVACNMYVGPHGLSRNGTWSSDGTHWAVQGGAQPDPLAIGITEATMNANPPPLNAMGT
jgi:hypothetical protein